MINKYTTWGSAKSEYKPDLENVRFKIDEALNDLNFQEVSKITLELQEKLNESSNLKSISSFNKFNLINENVKQAKQYYLKKVKQELEKKHNEYVKSKGHSAEEIDADDSFIDLEVEGDNDKPENKEPGKFKLSQHQEARILSNPDFLFVMDLVKSTPNYAITFVKFKFEQGADNDALSTIFDFVSDQQTKNFVKDLPLGSVEAYAKIETKEGETPGYMQLIDHIGEIEAAREGFWIIEAFVTKAGIRDTMGNIIPGKIGFNQKKAFKEAPQEVKDEIIKLAGDMNRQDDSGDLMRAFTRKMSNYESLDIIIQGLSDMVNSIGTQKEEVSMKHHKDYPASSVIWESSDKLLILYRSPLSLGENCRHTTWCIKPRGYGAGAAGSFYTYAKNGSLQFAMWDFSKPSTDDMSIVGFTVSSNGKISHAHRKDDRDVKSIVGYDLNELLSYYGVPDYSKEQILSSLKAESESMIAVEPIYREIEQGRGIQGVISKLIKSAEKRANISKFANEVDKSAAFTDRLIASEIAKSQNIDEIRDTAWKSISDNIKGGLTNVESARMFNTIFGGSEYARADKIDIILDINKDKQRRASAILALAKGENSEDNRILKYAMQKKQDIGEIINKAEILVNAIKEANVYLESLKK